MSVTIQATPTGPTEGCRYCWMCRQSCPVGHVTARETYTPHGWALMIESVARGQLAWTPESAGVMYACADCGLCQAHCVTDQPLPQAINDARVDLASSGLAPAVVYEIERRLTADGGLRGVAKQSAPRAGSVALFLGDTVTDETFAMVAAVTTLLNAIGISPVPLSDGRSSGLLASTLGLRDTAARLAKAVIADVIASGASEVLVLGPADRWTFTDVYAHRLGVAWPAGVRVRDVSEVLAEAVADGRLRFRPQAIGPYAYHDPCQTPRLERRPAPRALLAAALGEDDARDLFWRERRAHPCGVTGGLEITHPAIAGQLADARLTDAKSAGAARLIADDPACLRQLAGRSGSGVEVLGLYEVLAARL